jgi:large subunit ribosomal protein L21
MFAIFETGSKQYKVTEKDTFFAEKIEGKSGDRIVFDKVLMLDKEIGTPYLPKASVICEIVKQGKQEKLLIIKHISQKHHTKRQGHRQPYTQLVVKEINKGA